MKAKELREQRAKLVLDAQKIMGGDKVSKEQRGQVDKMLADAEELRKDAERLEQIDKLTEGRSAAAIPRGNPDGEGEGQPADARSHEEQRSATGKALRSWLKKEQFEHRDLSVSVNGGVMIPTAVVDPKVAKKAAGSVYDLVYKLRTATGEPVKAPMLNDIDNGFVLNSTASSTTDPATGGVTLSIDDIRSNPILLENSLLQDVEFDLVGFIEKSTNSRYLRTASKWITNGNGSNVASLLGLDSGVTSSTADVVTYGDLVNTMTALDPAYAIGAAWLMSTATVGKVLQIEDANGRPIFVPFNDGALSGFAGTILGYPVKINPYQPAVATGNVPIQFGDFEEAYTWREVLPGVVLKRLNERYAELNKVGFVAFARVGGGVTNAGGLETDTPVPVVALTIK
jgi:HK97 family phage major capsid protein